jgi:hypothetical protein
MPEIIAFLFSKIDPILVQGDQRENDLRGEKGHQLRDLSS